MKDEEGRRPEEETRMQELVWRCEECRNRPATKVYEVGRGYGPRVEVRICAVCAREHDEKHTGFEVCEFTNA
jgi:protein-arginine kinase activator protein McsA